MKRISMILMVLVLSLSLIPNLASADNEFYLGSDWSENAPANRAFQGYYSWAMLNVRPFWFKTPEGAHLGIGLSLFGALSSGNANGYEYKSRQIAIGPHLKFIPLSGDWDITANLRHGGLRADGEKSKSTGVFASKQVDDYWDVSLWLSNYHRRAQGKIWFSKFGLGLSLLKPYNTSYNPTWDGVSVSSGEYDNTRYEVVWVQEIYDFKASGIRITPGFNLGYGYEAGHSQNFSRVGPNITFDKGIYNVRVNFLNYERHGDSRDRWHWLGFTLKVKF